MTERSSTRLGHDPGSLEEVRALRGATRAVARDPALAVTQKCLALIEVGERGRAAELRRFAEQGVWAEARDFLGFPTPSEIPPRPGDRVEAACRRLHAEGYVRCPQCERELPSALDFERWGAYRAWALEEARAREGAA